MHLINFTNERLSERRIFNATKSLVIYDADVFIRALNKEASQILSERGCIMFHKALKVLGERRDKLVRLEEGGVQETFKDNSSKVYITTTDACDCTFRKEHLAPCHHILLLRKDDESLPMLDLDLFDYRYHRSRIENAHPINPQQSSVSYPREFEEEQEVSAASLTDREKYKAIMPILTNLGNLVACYPTKQFLRYIDDFKSIENLIRKGKSLVSDDIHDHPSVSTHESSTDHQLTDQTDQNSSTSEIQENQENQQPGTSSDHSNGQPSSMFQLKFKHSLSQRGRPKKRTKQLCFNRTAADKTQKTSVGNKAKKKRKRRPHQEVLQDMQVNDLSDMDVDMEQEEICLPSPVIFPGVEQTHSFYNMDSVSENSSCDFSRALSYTLTDLG